MGIGLRIFIVNDDDSLKRLSQAKFYRLAERDPKEKLPQYADKRIRYAIVYLDFVNRKPTEIVSIQYSMFSFDSDGRLDKVEFERERKLGFEVILDPGTDPRPTKVVDARQRFAMKSFYDRYTWKPSPDIEAAIVDAVFDKD